MNLVLFIFEFSFIVLIVMFLMNSVSSYFFDENEKMKMLESGFSCLDNSFFLFSIQFFLILIIFVLFDLEIIFLISLMSLSFSSFFSLLLMILFIGMSLFIEVIWGKLWWEF